MMSQSISYNARLSQATFHLPIFYTNLRKPVRDKGHQSKLDSVHE